MSYLVNNKVECSDDTFFKDIKRAMPFHNLALGLRTRTLKKIRYRDIQPVKETSEKFKERGYFNYFLITNNFKELCAGKEISPVFFWKAVNLETWFEIFMDQEDVE